MYCISMLLVGPGFICKCLFLVKNNLPILTSVKFVSENSLLLNELTFISNIFIHNLLFSAIFLF